MIDSDERARVRDHLARARDHVHTMDEPL
jgi:hypothetical protein